MIKSIEIENFKAIAASQTVPLKPITLIFGKNSAGKSSIIQSLALLHEAIRVGDVDVSTPKIGNGWIDLGGFLNYVHKHDQCKSVIFNIAFSNKGIHPFIKLHSPKNSRLSLALRIGFRGAEPDYDSVDGDFPELLDIAIVRNEKPILMMSCCGSKGLHGNQPTPGDDNYPAEDSRSHVEKWFDVVNMGKDSEFGSIAQWQMTTVDFGDPLLQHAINESFETRGISAWEAPELDEWAEMAVKKVLHKQIFSSESLLPSNYEYLDSGISRAQIDGFSTESPTIRAEGIAHLAAVLGRVVGSLVDAVRCQLEGDVNKLLYIGPIRQFPERGVKSRGSQRSDDPMLHAWSQITRDQSLRKEINTWLSSPEKLDTYYQFATKIYFSSALIERKILHAIQVVKDNLEVEEDDPEYETKLAGDLPAMLRSMDREQKEELCLVDSRSGIEVNHRDVGFGISQLIPILAACLGSKGKLICIEQPEIHIHPGLQAELADLFIESALNRGNQLLVETHSEHVILRLLRRIRDHSKKTKGKRTITPQDVAVLYVDSDSNGCFIKEIPITPDGEFATPWPHGFFTERFKEVY